MSNVVSMKKKQLTIEATYEVLLAGRLKRRVKSAEVVWTDTLLVFNDCKGNMIAAFPLDSVLGVVRVGRVGQ